MSSSKDDTQPDSLALELALLGDSIRSLDKKLDEVIAKIEAMAEDLDELSSDDEAESESSPKKAKKLTRTPGQLKPFGYNRGATFGVPTRGGLLRRGPRSDFGPHPSFGPMAYPRNNPYFQ